MISEVTSLSCWPQGNVYKEAAEPVKKCSLLWYPRRFHTWKQRKAGMGPETTKCLDNHSRGLSEVCKLSLRPSAQSAADHQVPKAGSVLMAWGWQKLPPALPCPSHTLGCPGPAPALPTSEREHSLTFWFWPPSWELKASSQAIFSWLC